LNRKAAAEVMSSRDRDPATYAAASWISERGLARELMQLARRRSPRPA